ncbi:secreted protein CSS1-like [Miscanthus floridulus]
MIDSEYAIPDDAVNHPAPSVSKSGKPFNLRPISPTSPIGYNAPTLAALTHQKIRTKTITSKSKLAISRATPSAAATTLVKAFKGVRAATGSSSAIPPISSTTPSEQQLGTSANVPDAQASQPTSVDAPQPIVADVQAKRKASTDTEAQPKRQRSMPIPTSAPMSSVITPQEPTTDEVTEDIPSASSADPHDILQVASSSQAQEIALKQEQDSPNSLFSFAIDISDDDGEETSSSLALGTISAETKSKLETLLNLLQ